MTRIAMISGAVLVAVVGALWVWGRLGSFDLHTTAEIDAPPEAVWDVLTDFDAYPDWNPFIVRISGELREGASLSADLEGSAGMTITPTVLVADSSRELRWRGQLGIPGIVDGEHWFTLTDLGNGRTRLDHGEDFSGAAVPVLWPPVLAPTGDSFEQMNAALAEEVERRAAARP